MLSKAIHFSRIHLDSMHLSFPRSDLINGLHGEPSRVMQQWFAVINHVDELILANGIFDFTDTKIPWQARKVSGRIAARTFDLSGNVKGGSLHLHGKQNSDSFRGMMDWQGMVTTGMSRILGLEANMHGSSSGLLNWQANWPHRHFMFDGHIRFEDQPGQGNMRIQGEMEPENIKVQAKCRELSLTGLGNVLPTINGRNVRSGILNGNVQLERQGHGRWTVDMSGKIHDIRLASESLPAWTIDSIMLDHAVVQWPVHKLHIERLHVRNMDMLLQPGKTRSPVSPWHFQVDHLTFENVRPAINIHGESHRLILPPLKGSGHMAANDYMELDADSAGEEIWHIAGKGHVDKSFYISIQAGNVPIVRLRPLLPDLSLHGSGGPLQLSGNSKLRILLQAGHNKLTLKGQATLTDVMASQGGDIFLADAIYIDIQQAGTMKTQHMGSIRMNNWRYQAALHPIPHTVEAEVKKKPEVQHQKLSWQVDKVVAEHGSISVGSENAVWADHVSFSLNHMRPGTWSPLMFYASVSGGSLRVQGSVDLFSSDVKMKLNARLQDALPFFLNNWLMISGSPRLTRGRLNGSFSIKPAHGKHAYTGALHLVLYQGQFESGAYPQDPMLLLTGHSMQDLLDRLGKRGRMGLHIPFRGDWHTQPFSIKRMGIATLNMIKRRASLTNGLPPAQSTIKTVSNVRLQHGRAFSHNEHARLWQVVKALRKQPKLIVELLPQLGHTPLDESLISRIRHTQAMIEYYMHIRGISRHRIYPVWPLAALRHGEITGIKITARMP